MTKLWYLALGLGVAALVTAFIGWRVGEGINPYAEAGSIEAKVGAAALWAGLSNVLLIWTGVTVIVAWAGATIVDRVTESAEGLARQLRKGAVQ